MGARPHNCVDADHTSGFACVGGFVCVGGFDCARPSRFADPTRPTRDDPACTRLGGARKNCVDADHTSGFACVGGFVCVGGFDWPSRFADPTTLGRAEELRGRRPHERFRSFTPCPGQLITPFLTCPAVNSLKRRSTCVVHSSLAVMRARALCVMRMMADGVLCCTRSWSARLG